MNNQQAALLWAVNLLTREIAKAKSRHESTQHLEQHRKELNTMLNDNQPLETSVQDLILAIASGVETLSKYRPESMAHLMFIENATGDRVDCHQAITAITVKLEETLQTLEDYEIAHANRDASLSTLVSFEGNLLRGRE